MWAALFQESAGGQADQFALPGRLHTNLNHSGVRCRSRQVDDLRYCAVQIRQVCHSTGRCYSRRIAIRLRSMTTIMITVAAVSAVMIMVATIVPEGGDHTQKTNERDDSKSSMFLHFFTSLDLRLPMISRSPSRPAQTSLPGSAPDRSILSLSAGLRTGLVL